MIKEKKKVKSLTRDEKTHISDVLKEKIVALEKQILEDGKIFKEESGGAKTFDEIASNGGLQDPTAAGRVKLYRSLQNALIRMKNNSYSNICADCKSEIELVRLLAVPHTTVCVHCQDIRQNKK